MSTSKFWTRDRARPEEIEHVKAAGSPVSTRPLTAVDRCDRCGARAYVRVLLPGRLQLLFCGHHMRQHASALAKIAVEIQGEIGWLARVGLVPREGPS